MKQVLVLDTLLKEDALQPANFDEEMGLPTEAAANDGSDDFPLAGTLSLDEVPQKNTFIHYDLRRLLNERPKTPTKSAPGVLLTRLFKTKSDGNGLDADVPKSSLSRQSVLSSLTDNSTLYTSDCDSEASTTDSPADSTAGPSSNLDIEPKPDLLYLHQLGQCTPCNYFRYKSDGCRQGSECSFCHHCPKGELKRRKKEQIRQLKRANNPSRKW